MSFPNRRGSRVAGFKSRVAGFEKVAGFQKSRVFKRHNEEQNLHVIKLMRIFARLSLHLLRVVYKNYFVVNFKFVR